MALQTSGAISFSQLQSEFGGSNPISLSEYYRGGSYVPTQVLRDADAASLSHSESHTNRGSTYTTIPCINCSGGLYYHRLWEDNGRTGSVDSSFTVNKTGSYQYRFSLYETGGQSGTFRIYVNGTLKNTWTKSSSSGWQYYTSSVTANAGDTIRVTATWGSGGWGGTYIQVGGVAYNDDNIQSNVNTSVPSSGTIDLSDFYGGTKT